MNDKRALELYRLAREDEISWLNLYRQYSQQYFALVAALFGVSLGAIYHFRNEPWFSIAIIVGPILGALLSIIAVKTCDRFYQRFLESVTIQAKLEPLVGVTEKRSISADSPQLTPFPDDVHYIPERWFESRSQRTAADFVQVNKRKGSNKYVVWSFRVLLMANMALIVGILVNAARLLQILPCLGI